MLREVFTMYKKYLQCIIERTGSVYTHTTPQHNIDTFFILFCFVLQYFFIRNHILDIGHTGIICRRFDHHMNGICLTTTRKKMH
jgi:hypothetical protein